ncbi:MAG: exo-alpha-sialidase [Clostridiales bacterium]|nr:exo-alpha-sialidase [Clostridiales bacterium]
MSQFPAPVFEIENLCNISAQAPDLTAQLKPYTNLEEGTVIIRFRNYELHSGGAALLTFVNNQYPASYLSIYIVVASMVGFVKKVIAKDYSEFHTIIVNADEQAQVNMINTLAVRIKAREGYRIYLNGHLIREMPDPNACFLRDISLRGSIDTILAGKMVDAQKMKQREMLFHGDIDFIRLYDTPLEHELLCAFTGQTASDYRVRIPEKGHLTPPVKLCASGYQGAGNFRIPVPLRTLKGTLLVAFDKMFHGPQDHPNRIQLVMRRSEDGGQTWKHAQTLVRFPGNAQAIDSCMVQDRDTGRIFLLTSTYPENVTVFTSDSGVGYVKENNVMKRILVDDAARRYLVQPDGTVTLDGIPTGFTARRNGTELYRDGQMVGYTYMEKCPLRVPLTSFLLMLTSDDDGKTWSEPIDLNPLLKKDWMHFWGCGPGTGIQLKRGAHKGRLLMQTYCFNKHSIESPMFIYSDDHGATWHMGETINDHRLYDGKIYSAETADHWDLDSSESQGVELPNGTVLLFAKNYRNPTRCIAVAASLDGGETFEPTVRHDPALHSTYSMSVIEWPVPIDGRTAYFYASSDSRAGNYNGAIKTGFFCDDGHGGHIEWQHSRLFKPGTFGYCFLCPVTEDTLGVAYESSGALHLSFQKMDIPFLLSSDDTPLNPVKLLDVQLRANDQGTLITLVFDQLIMLTGERIVYALCGEKWRAASYAGRRNDSRSYDFQLDAAFPSSILSIALSEKADVVSGNGMLYHFDRASGTLLWQYYNRPYISLKGSGAV